MELRDSSSIEEIAEILDGIVTTNGKKGLDYFREGKYQEAAVEYDTIARAYNDAYNRAIQVMTESTADSTRIKEIFRKGRKFWEESAQVCRKEDLLRKTNELKNEAYKLQLGGLYEESIKLFKEALELNATDDPEICMYLGNSYFHLSKYYEAIKCYDKALQIDPNNALAWYWKGYSFYELGNNEEAIKCYDKALQIEPIFLNALIAKANSFYELGNNEEAIKCYDKALQIDPNNALAWHLKGYSFYELGNNEEAIKCYDKALQIDPNNDVILNNKAWSFAMIGRGLEALRIIKKSIEINPKVSDYFDTMGFVYYKLGEYEESIKHYNKATEIDANNYLFWTHKASSFQKLNRHKEAQDCLNRAEVLKIEAKKQKSLKRELLLNSLFTGTETAVQEPEETQQDLIDQLNAPDQIKIKQDVQTRGDGWYHWSVFLDAGERGDSILDQIESVKYDLHPTFPDPEPTKDRNNKFILNATGWGEFEIKANITLKDGRTITKYHWLALRNNMTSSTVSR